MLHQQSVQVLVWCSSLHASVSMCQGAGKWQHLFLLPVCAKHVHPQGRVNIFAIFSKKEFSAYFASLKTLLGDNRKFNIKGKLNLSDNGKDRAYRNNIKQICIYQFSKWLANRIIRSCSRTFTFNAKGQYFRNDSGRSNILIYRWISLQSCIMVFGSLQSTKRPLHFRFILSEGYHVVAPV